MAFTTYQLYYVSGGVSLPIFPDFSIDEQRLAQRKFYRSQGGQLNSYKLRGGHFQVGIPLTQVSSSNASIINGWWKSQVLLNFIETGGAENGTIAVKIKNTTEPFPMNADGAQYNYFKGFLNLVSDKDVYSFAFDNIAKDSVGNALLVLDDAVFGKLDINLLG